MPGLAMVMAELRPELVESCGSLAISERSISVCAAGLE